jgi:hypothetical protein
MMMAIVADNAPLALIKTIFLPHYPIIHRFLAEK